MSRLFDYRCRSCGKEHVLTASVGDEPGTIMCRECWNETPISWWRSRPSVPFVKPDTTGIVFGPKADEFAEMGRPFARVRDDRESMELKKEAPDLNRDAKRQLRLIP
jgi:hypothetical protein